MATSGTINGTISGYKPYLRINWSRIETDVGGNRSKLRLQLYLMHPYTVRYSATKSGVLQGSSFNSTTNVSGTGSTLLRTQDVWVGHNSDGSKTQRLSASFNINITYSGSWLGQLTVSGNANITSIPRASTLSAFSFNAHLKNGTANQINYTIDRKSTGFRHQIQLRDGNTVVRTWDNISSNGKSTLPLTASEVNTLLNRIKTSTTKSFTLRVATRSGNNGGWIGSAVSRNATATVHDDVKPTVGAVSLSQTGNSVSSHYLQGRSKVNAKFTRSAGYGASISSSSIQVRRVSGGADSQTINSNDGTTKNPVSLNGSYQARGTATDSRGRTTNTAWATFTVTAYSGPRITNFTAVRSSSAETTVSISRAGTHTHLGGSNVLTYTVQRRIGTGAWTNVNTNATGTSTTASFSGTSTSTGNSVTTSYDFRLVITDKFGESATATVTVSTQRVVLDIHKNEGVGIGKLHEFGVLDVDGPASFGHTGFDVSGQVPVVMRIKTSGERTGVILGVDPDNSPVWQIGNRMLNSRSLYLEASSAIRMTSGRVLINGDEIADSGTHTNGDWVRFYNGTQICWNTVNLSYKDPSHLELFWSYPVDFIDDRTSGSFIRDTHWGGFGERLASPTIWHGSTSAQIRLWAPQGATWGSTSTVRGTVFAIGRWK